MRTRRCILWGGLVACGWLATHLASPLWGQPQPQPEPQNPSAAQAGDVERDLELRYAQAYLKLMEATLAKYEEINRRTPNTIRPLVIQAGQQLVAKAREQLQLAQGDEAGSSKLQVARAENDLKIVEESLRRAEEANRRRPGTIQPGEIARLQAEREVDRIKVERARHRASTSAESSMRLELDDLRADVQELQYLVAILRSGRL